MSIKLMTMVWESDLQTSKKMAMLALCDWANDDGGSVYPSIARLAKRISCSERQAQRIVHALIEEDGLVSVVGNAFGGAPGQSRQYRINVSKLLMLSMGVAPPAGKPAEPAGSSAAQTGDILTPVDNEGRGDILTPVRVTPMTPTGDTGVTLSPMYPSLNTPLPPDGGVCDLGFQEFWDAYPQKHGEVNARRQWVKLAPDVALRKRIVDVVRVQAATDAWKRDGGRFVPHASKWLAAGRWADVVVGIEVGGVVHDPDSKAGVELVAVRLGLPKWDCGMEQWPTYRARVRAAERAAAGA